MMNIDGGVPDGEKRTTDFTESTDSQGVRSMSQLTLRVRLAEVSSRSLSVLSEKSVVPHESRVPLPIP